MGFIHPPSEIARTCEYCVMFCTVRLPPTIVKGPDTHYIFRDTASIEMTCVATSSVNIK